jgi:hypothetical protein
LNTEFSYALTRWMAAYSSAFRVFCFDTVYFL